MKKINAGLIGTGFGESHLQLLSQIESINISWGSTTWLSS